MDTTTSEMVERLYASGEVERPTIDCERKFSYDGTDWAYRRPSYWTIQEASPESVIGWDLVRACWAKGWVLQPFAEGMFCVYMPNQMNDYCRNACPIRAMAEALGGGE